MDASHAMDTWTANCVAQTGMQNVYDGKDGRRYFWEISRREHDDGAITGSTYRETGEYAHKTGAIRIEGNGDVTRYPTSWPFAKPAPFVVPTFSASWDTLDAASLPPISGGAHDDDGYPALRSVDDPCNPVRPAGRMVELDGQRVGYYVDYGTTFYAYVFLTVNGCPSNLPGTFATKDAAMAAIAADWTRQVADDDAAEAAYQVAAVAPVVAPQVPDETCDRCGAILWPERVRTFGACPFCPPSHSDLDLLSRPESLPAKPFGVCPSCNYSAAATWTVDHCPSCGGEPAEESAHFDCSHDCQDCYPAAECAAQAERYAANNLAAGDEGAAEYYQVIAAEYRARIPAGNMFSANPDAWAQGWLDCLDAYGRMTDKIQARASGQTLAAVAITNVGAFLLVLAVLAWVIRANLPDVLFPLV